MVVVLVQSTGHLLLRGNTAVIRTKFAPGMSVNIGEYMFFGCIVGSDYDGPPS